MIVSLSPERNSTVSCDTADGQINRELGHSPVADGKMLTTNVDLTAQQLRRGAGVAEQGCLLSSFTSKG